MVFRVKTETNRKSSISSFMPHLALIPVLTLTRARAHTHQPHRNLPVFLICHIPRCHRPFHFLVSLWLCSSVPLHLVSSYLSNIYMQLRYYFNKKIFPSFPEQVKHPILYSLRSMDLSIPAFNTAVVLHLFRALMVCMYFLLI